MAVVQRLIARPILAKHRSSPSTDDKNIGIPADGNLRNFRRLPSAATVRILVFLCCFFFSLSFVVRLHVSCVFFKCGQCYGYTIN